MSGEFPLSDEAKSFIESAEILAEPWREAVARLTRERDDAQAKLAEVEGLIDQSRKVSPSDSMTVYVGDLEKALGRRADSVRGIRGAES